MNRALSKTRGVPDIFALLWIFFVFGLMGLVLFYADIDDENRLRKDRERSIAIEQIYIGMSAAEFKDVTKDKPTTGHEESLVDGVVITCDNYLVLDPNKDSPGDARICLSNNKVVRLKMLLN